jgi:ribosomal protein S18 acetylase RimI-like enzyme
VASTYRVQNPYFNGAIRTDASVSPVDFLADVQAFFGALNRAYRIWIPTHDRGLRAAAAAMGAEPEVTPSPAMAIRNPIAVSTTRYTIRAATTPEALAAFGKTVEAGYEAQGLAWLLSDQDSYGAPGTIWATAYDGDAAVGAACGFLSGTAGGIYIVGTPPEHRGKQVASEVTQWVANALIDQGAACVTLQSSQIGFSVYKKLGFSVCGYYERMAVAAPVA